MKIVVLAFTLASCAFADIITFKGIVTDAPANGSVTAGEAFTAWLNFNVLSDATGEPWTPGALDISCSFSGECDGAPSGYTAALGAVGASYSGGARWGFATWALDGGFVKLNADLSVADAGVGSGLVYFYGSSTEDGLFSDNYAVPDLEPVTGIVTSAEYGPVAQIPEPSTFAATAAALLGVIVRRRVHRAKRVANHSRMGSS